MSIENPKDARWQRELKPSFISTRTGEHDAGYFSIIYVQSYTFGESLKAMEREGLWLGDQSSNPVAKRAKDVELPHGTPKATMTEPGTKPQLPSAEAEQNTGYHRSFIRQAPRRSTP